MGEEMRESCKSSKKNSNYYYYVSFLRKMVIMEEGDARKRYCEGRFGTQTVGLPCSPDGHPRNREAATWEPLPYYALHQQQQQESEECEHRGVAKSSSSSYGRCRVHACQRNPAQSQTGYAGVPDPHIPGNPYIFTSTATPNHARKGPTDGISDYLRNCTKKWNEISKKAETVAGNIWNHAKTGPNIADTAWGRLIHASRLICEGGLENVYQKNFETQVDEKLEKTYACYLSTSSGPVAGTVYISTHKVAFCSDRPLVYTPHVGQTYWIYYKVIVPLDKFKEVHPSSNINHPEEKYIQIVTADNHEFWFMGFVNYEKALKNLMKAQPNYD